MIYEVMEAYNRQNYSREQCRAFFDLLERTKGAAIYRNDTLVQIIMEEGQPYLMGSRSPEETGEDIQSRISIYMSEQYK